MMESIDALILRDNFVDMSMLEWKQFLEKTYGVAGGTNMYLALEAKILKHWKDSKYFVYKDKEWFDSETRASLKNLIVNLDTPTFILKREVVEIPKEKALLFLNDLEVYSYNCRIALQKHINRLSDLKTIDDLLAYSFNDYYPEPINLNDYL